MGVFIGVSPKPLTDVGWSAFSAQDDAVNPALTGTAAPVAAGASIPGLTVAL